jgi:IclR family acetate operon transcriptional repressor
MPVYQNRSVGRVLSILELLGNTSKALTLTEIARGVSLDASTAYRALRALCERGFVYRIEPTRRYVLSYNAFRLGSPDRVVQGINNRARMIMVRLAKEVNETIRLGVLEGAEARFCAEAGVVRPGLRMLGAMVDAHASAAGKALIAWRSRADIELLYRGRSMHAYSERTIRSVPMLLGELAEVRNRGWAVSEGEGLRPDDRGLAVPCFDSNGHVRFSLAIASTRKRLPPARDKAALPKLFAAAREMSDALGLATGDWVPPLGADYSEIAASYYCPTPQGQMQPRPAQADAQVETSRA